MNIPNIPTDNYYKFFALSGVTITIASTIIYLTQSNVLKNDLNKMDIEIVKLKVEKTFLIEDRGKTDRELESLPKIDSSLSSINQDSAFTVNLLKEIKSVNNKKIKDYYEFIFKYEDNIFPQKSKLHKITEEVEKQSQIRREIELKTALIKTNLKHVEEKNRTLTINGIILCIFFIIGSQMAARGFIKWYKLVQKPSDEKLRLEIEDMKKKNTDKG